MAMRRRQQRILDGSIYERINVSGAVRTPRLVEPIRPVLQRPGPQPARDLAIPATLSAIEHITQVNFTALPAFVKPSADRRLLERTVAARCAIGCSTSSITSALANVFFAVGAHRPVDTSYLSSAFRRLPKSMTTSTRAPSSVMVHRVGDAWIMDHLSTPASPARRILMDLGKSLEHKLTMEHDDYVKLVLKNASQVETKDSRFETWFESFAFTQIGTIMVRSQLDCSDPDLPGPHQTFDLKTRAVLPIRHNLATYEQHLEYDLESMEGEFNSFEREVYDLSRTVMLKYSMQVRLGRMNGVLVAYHNTNRFFGFEYISLERMDEILVGDTRTANRLFDISFKLLERTLTEILNDFSSEPAMKLTFRAPAKMPGSLQVFVELDPPAIEQLSEQDLIAKLNEFGVSMPGASVGALLTRYDECLREEDPAFKQTYEILPLYEKAAQGKLFLYEMFATHLVNGHDIQHRHELLNLKSARKDLTTVYQFGPHHEQGPLSVAREYWYALKEGERPESNEPKLFMYPDKGYKR